MGVEDFDSGNRDRSVSAARNIHCGLLLLYKEKLRQLSPPNSNEALLKEAIAPKIDDGGAVQWVGSGHRTANTKQIQDRLMGLRVDVDWAALVHRRTE
jgi:hypothetical protein